MMSSCCTLRLKRRSAFERYSPSCSLTSANGLTPQNSSHLDGIVIARFSIQVKNYNHVTQEKCGLQHETALISPFRKSVSKRPALGGEHRRRWLAGSSPAAGTEPGREVIDSSLVITVEQVERFGHQIELDSIMNIQTAS